MGGNPGLHAPLHESVAWSSEHAARAERCPDDASDRPPGGPAEKIAGALLYGRRLSRWRSSLRHRPGGKVTHLQICAAQKKPALDRGKASRRTWRKAISAALRWPVLTCAAGRHIGLHTSCGSGMTFASAKPLIARFVASSTLASLPMSTTRSCETRRLRLTSSRRRVHVGTHDAGARVVCRLACLISFGLCIAVQHLARPKLAADDEDWECDRSALKRVFIVRGIQLRKVPLPFPPPGREGFPAAGTSNIIHKQLSTGKHA